MTDYVTHEAVDSVAGTVARVGGTRRRQVVVRGVEPPANDVVRVVIDGTEHRAPVEETSDGVLTLLGAYDTPSQARERSGTDHLASFLEAHDRHAGRTVHVDVVEPGSRFGLRAPGQRATYRAVDGPSSSLADIARNLDS